MGSSCASLDSGIRSSLKVSGPPSIQASHETLERSMSFPAECNGEGRSCHFALQTREAVLPRTNTTEQAFPGSQPACHVCPALCICRGLTDSPLDATEKLYTYSIITTDSNKQLNFLHDRMPVILDNGSDAIRTWLDPHRTEWSKDLQSLLKPYDGELECYPVSKDVGKVGNNSPSFLVPINSSENKNNIANFFGTQKKAAKTKAEEPNTGKVEHDLNNSIQDDNVKVEHDTDEPRATTNRVEGTEDNAPLPVPATSGSQTSEQPKGIKREHSEAEDDGATADAEPPHKLQKPASSASPTKTTIASPTKTPAKKQGTRSATSNGSAAKTTKGDGSKKITSFFSNK